MSNIFNKALIASAVLVASAGVAYANGGTYAPEPVVAGPVHNCYVGVAVSRDFAHFKFDREHVLSTVDDNGVATDISIAREADLGNDGWNGELYVGYGGTFQDHYYLAAEIFGDISSIKADFNEGIAITNSLGDLSAAGVEGNVKLRYEYGIDLIPGVKVSDSTMLFGKLGWIRGKFRFNAEGVVLASVPAGFTSFTTNRNGSFESNHTSNGIQLGVGLETMVTNNCSVKIEYDWNRYGSTFGVSHPTVDEAKVGVAYHFASV